MSLMSGRLMRDQTLCYIPLFDYHQRGIPDIGEGFFYLLTFGVTARKGRATDNKAAIPGVFFDDDFQITKQSAIMAFSLITNDTMNAVTALELYRNKNVVEKAFGNLKERLNMRRTLVSSEQSLDGKVFIQFVALIRHSASNILRIIFFDMRPQPSNNIS